MKVQIKTKYNPGDTVEYTTHNGVRRKIGRIGLITVYLHSSDIGMYYEINSKSKRSDHVLEWDILRMIEPKVTEQ